MPRADDDQDFHRVAAELQLKRDTAAQLTRELSEARDALQAMRARAGRLRGDLDRAIRGVRALDGWGIKRLCASLFSDRKARLVEAQRVIAVAGRELDAVDASIRDQERVMSDLRARRGALGDLDEEARRLADARQRRILADGGPVADELSSIVGRIDAASAGLERLRQAKECGRKAERVLRTMAGRLDSAKSWGMADVLGGGFVTTLVKRAKMNDAHADAKRAETLLRRLDEYLSDLNTRPSVRVDYESGGFEAVADYALDGAITDWVIQSRIAASHDRSKHTLRRVTRVVREVASSIRSHETELAALESRRAQLLGLDG